MRAIDATATTDLETDLSDEQNMRSIIARFPNMEMCSVNESSVNNMELRCIVCGSQGFVDKQKKCFEISLSGFQYNPRTLRYIDHNRTFFKVIILVFSSLNTTY